MPTEKRVFTIVGTRPDAIKLAPVIRAIHEQKGVEPVVVLTAQHRELVDQVLDVFAIEVTFDLNLMEPGQTLPGFASRAINSLGEIFARENPDLVLVQGDTTTAMAGALAGHYCGAGVAHVEAGLRSFDLGNPFPEEANRRIISQLAGLHFAPTDTNRRNLIAEGVPEERIHVTGNPVIDALMYVGMNVTRGGLPDGSGATQTEEEGSRLLLVTLHRRESFGASLESICDALHQIVEDDDSVHLLFPVHPNPNVKNVVFARLSDHPRIKLVEPLGYVQFVAAMQRAYLVITDSGGVQEEAPSLKKPVLVIRDATERPEVVRIGAARLVGREPAAIISSVTELLHSRRAYEAMTEHPNPYGDGKAAGRIAEAIGRAMGDSGVARGGVTPEKGAS